MTRFVAVDMVHPSLFTPEKPATATSKLIETIDAVNGKSGREMVQIGWQTAATTWLLKQADLSLAYTTNWNTFAVVKTNKNRQVES